MIQHMYTMCAPPRKKPPYACGIMKLGLKFRLMFARIQARMFFEYRNCGNKVAKRYTRNFDSKCKCGHNKIRNILIGDSDELEFGCCPNWFSTCVSSSYLDFDVKCPNGQMRPFGSYCETINQCLVSWINRTMIPCKNNHNGEYQCLEPRELHKVCRGIATTTTCIK